VLSDNCVTFKQHIGKLLLSVYNAEITSTDVGMRAFVVCLC